MIPDGFSLFRNDLDYIGAGVRPLRGALAGASILVTGATGFFGMWLVEGLLWASTAHDLSLRVTMLSRDGPRFLAGRGRHLGVHPNLTVLSGDVASFDDHGHRFTHIIHAANEGAAGHAASRHIGTAIGGTRHIIDLAAAHGTEAVLLTSSGAVYRPLDPPSSGASAEGPAGAADYTVYRAVYAEAKRMTETMLAAGSEQHGFRAAIARCFAFTGAYLPLDGGQAMGNFVGDALAGRKIGVAGDGTAVRSYLYGADLAIWLLTVLVRGKSGRPYNVGGDEAMTVAELARLVSAAAGDTGVEIRGAAQPGATADIYLPDLTRSAGELGLRAGIPTRDAIRRTLDWYTVKRR
ncbi:NAD-dependent epimerase/dehydratase family protein [Emcibacter sp. SYSU 3D8]|uniref:NAD-dependent epimerase/dehydratase family protein n=1 Tax=Emcibacter sp. SYSU 3D8 TaxID=3133969 RepID=UPI0031FE577A